MAPADDVSTCMPDVRRLKYRIDIVTFLVFPAIIISERRTHTQKKARAEIEKENKENIFASLRKKKQL